MPLFLKQSALLARWVTRKGLTVPLGKHGNKQFNKGKGVPATGRITRFGACACALTVGSPPLHAGPPPILASAMRGG